MQTLSDGRIVGSIKEIKDHIDEVAKSHEDVTIPINKVQYSQSFDGFEVKVGNDWERWKFTQHAVNQLNAKLRMPGPYLDRCPPFLKEENYRYWFNKASGAECLFRTTIKEDGERSVDGILSKKVYTVIDNHHMMSGLEKYLDSSDVIQLEFDGRNMYAKIITNKTDIKTKDGHVIKGGFHVFNSEVGNGSAAAEILMYNSVSKDGIITRGWGGYRQQHRGKNSAQAVIELGESLDSMSGNLSGAINQAVDLQNVHCVDPEGLKDFLCESSKPQLTKKQTDVIDDMFSSGKVNTYWDIVNVFARAGSSPILSVEQRTDIMRIAGRVIHEAKTRLKIFRQR